MLQAIQAVLAWRASTVDATQVKEVRQCLFSHSALTFASLRTACSFSVLQTSQGLPVAFLNMCNSRTLEQVDVLSPSPCLVVSSVGVTQQLLRKTGRVQ